MEDTDFDWLCNGLPADEAKCMRKIFVEWCDGDENGFPVQLALLTRAQWRAAALVPQAVNDSRKMIELHLAEYRRQTAVMIKDFADTVDKKTNDLKDIIAKHAESVKHDSWFVRSRLAEADEASKRIRDSLDWGVSEWNQSKNALAEERQRFEKVCREFDDRLQLRGVLWYSVGLIGMLGMGIIIERYLGH